MSNKTWNKIFKSKFLNGEAVILTLQPVIHYSLGGPFSGLEKQLIYYFYVLVAILVLFFLDALRYVNVYRVTTFQPFKNKFLKILWHVSGR